ncbi:MAG TPA: acetolactate synthase large subunit [Tianweitania sediminis]|nr:acetolactate synthase large subunit [Tianweitania sediminis]
MTSGADILCDTLLANGVDVCFANPGTSEMHFVAALDRKPQMRCVLGLFEGVVTGAADGYARMADKPAVTLLHLGPGLTNGLANLHNARRARTPIINIVGDHATYHRKYDSPLTSDIESLARPMSHWFRSIAGAGDIMRDTNEAFAAARDGRAVATLVLPADAAWETVPAPDIFAAALMPQPPVPDAMVTTVASAIGAGRRVTFVLAGNALRAAALPHAARLAALDKVEVRAQATSGRMERGGDRLPLRRIPFQVDAAIAELADTQMLVLVGATEPVAFFAYPGKKSRLVAEGCEVVTLASQEQDLVEALCVMADAAGAPKKALSQVKGDMPDLPAGALNGDAIAAAVAKLLPENAIVVDESVTSAPRFYDASLAAAPHDYLALTGGSIGIGMPLSVGAAVACPDRKVVALQADGSGMYTLQALWTQARERLDVVTIILANRTYNILQHEMRNVGVEDFGVNARRMLNLDDPTLDWVGLARGMGVKAISASTSEEFTACLRSALSERGPFLIQADL